MNKINDWFAANLNCPDFTMDQMVKAGVTPDNTTLQSKDYYKTVPQVKAQFTDTSTGKFDDEKFNAYYDALSRSYNTFAETEFVDHWLESIESSPYDIFSTDQPSFDATVKMIRNSGDPQRHSVGISGMGRTGDPVFDEREVAQANFVRDENGNKLDYTPNDKWALGTLFSKNTYVMAQYDEDGYYNENGMQVFHRKGERKYDENGDPYYEILGKRSVLGRDVLHVSDVVTRDDSWINKLDFLDADSLETSVGKTIFKTLSQVALFAVPHVGPYMGAVKAVLDFGSVMPKLGKALDGLFTGDATDGSFGSAMEQMDAWMSRFDKSTTQYAKEHQWAFENIGDMIGSSAGQLYSQRCIAQIPKLFKNSKNITKLPKVSTALSVGYMALTSAEETYNTFKQAGASDRMAGIGFLLTSAAYYKLMDNDYYKQWLFKNTDLVTNPEMQYTVRSVAKEAADTLNKKIGTNAISETGKKAAEMEVAKNFWTKLKGLKKFTNKVPKGNAYPTTGEKVNLTLHAYANHAMNEGLEEFMEEGVIDIVKGISEGAEALGLKVTDKDHEKLNFGWSVSEMLNRYVSSFVGGALGGAVFEGLTRWENYWSHGFGKVDSFSDYALDRKFRWYLLNGYEQDLRKTIEYERRKGNLGNKNLTWSGSLTKDANGNNVWAFDSVTDSNSKDNQNDQMANMLNAKITAIKAQINTLGLLDFNYKDIRQKDAFIEKAEKSMEADAAKEGINVEEYKKKHGWTLLERIINDSKVDDAIFSEVMRLQDTIFEKQTAIDNIKKEYEEKVTDKNQAAVQELMDKDESVKILEKEVKEAKKEYQELLEGKRAAEFWGLSVYAHNDVLRNLYHQNEAQEGTNYTSNKDVNYYAKTHYNMDFEDMNHFLQDVVRKEHVAYELKDSTDSEYFIRAYNTHRRMIDRFDPIIKSILPKISHDEGKLVVDSSVADLTFFDFYKQMESRLKELHQEEADLIIERQQNNTPAINTKLQEIGNEISSLQDQVTFWKKQIDAKNPEILRRAYASEGVENVPAVDITSSEINIQSTLISLKQYLQYLIDNKVVMAYDNPIYDIAIERVVNTLKQILNEYINTWEGLAKNNNEKLQFFEEMKYMEMLEDGSISLNEEMGINQVLTEHYKDDPIPEQGIDKSNWRSAEDKYIEDVRKYLGDDGVYIAKALLAGKLSLFSQLDETGKEVGLSEIQNAFLQTNKKLVQNNIYINSSYDNVSEDGLALLNASANLNFNRDTKSIFEPRTSEKSGDSVETMRALIDTIGTKLMQGEDVSEVISDFNNVVFSGGHTESLEEFALGAFKDLKEIIPQLQEIKEMKAAIRPSPIVDILENVSMRVGDDHMPILDFLRAEVEKNSSPAILNEYSMNPKAAVEIQRINTYLQTVKIIIAGMSKGGFNEQLNLAREITHQDGMEEGEPYTIIDNQQFEILHREFNYIQDRIKTLLAISEGNTKSLAEKQLDNDVNMQPKYVKRIINGAHVILPKKETEESNEEITLESLWLKACEGTEFDEKLNNITRDNYAAFQEIVWKWHDLIHEQIKSLSPEQLESWWSSLFEGDDAIFKNLRNDGGTYSDDKNIEITPMSAAMYLLRIVGLDPAKYRGIYKGRLNRNGDYPFGGQEMVIGMAVAAIRNKNLFNIILKNIEKNKESSYLKNRSYLENLFAILGHTGVGKSKIMVKTAIDIVKEFCATEEEKQEVEVFAVTRFNKRLKEMQSELGLDDAHVQTSEAFLSDLCGHTIDIDDYDQNVIETLHTCKASDKILEVARSEKAKEALRKKFKVDSTIKILALDEGSFESEAELQIFTQAAKEFGFFILLTGDLNQQCAIRRYAITDPNDASKKIYKLESSGLEDCVYVAGPTLTVSMRASNEGMYNSTLALNKPLDAAMVRLKENPDQTTAQLLPKEELVQIGLQYHETNSGLSGMRLIDDGVEGYVKKFDNWTKDKEKGNVAIITDQKNKYSSLASENVIVISPEEVQGQEFDYVAIDVDTLNERYIDKFNLLKSINTWLTRAKEGAVIVKKDNFIDKNSLFIDSQDIKIASQRIDIKVDKASDFEAYKDMIDNLYRNVTAISSTPTTTPENGSSGTNGSGSTGSNSSGNKGKPTGSETNPSPRNKPKINYEPIKPSVLNDTERDVAINEALWKDDEGNYIDRDNNYNDKKHYENHKGLLNSENNFEKDGYFSLESFYRWTTTDEFKNLVCSDYYASPFANSKDNFIKIRAFIKAFTYAIFDTANNDASLSEAVKRALYKNPDIDGLGIKPSIKTQSGSTYTRINDFVDALCDALKENNKHCIIFKRNSISDIYAQVWFCFTINKRKLAIPIGKMNCKNIDFRSDDSSYSRPYVFAPEASKEYALAPLTSTGKHRVALSQFRDKVGSVETAAVFRPASTRNTNEINWPEALKDKPTAQKFYKSAGRLYILWSLQLNRDKDVRNSLFDEYFKENYSGGRFQDFTSTKGEGDSLRISGANSICKYNDYVQKSAFLKKIADRGIQDTDDANQLRALGMTEDDINSVRSYSDSTDKALDPKRERREILDKYAPINYKTRLKLFSAILRNAHDNYSNWQTLRANLLSNIVRKYVIGKDVSIFGDKAQKNRRTYMRGLQLNFWAANDTVRYFVYIDKKGTLHCSRLGESNNFETSVESSILTEFASLIRDGDTVGFNFDVLFEFLLKNNCIPEVGNVTKDDLIKQFTSGAFTILPATHYEFYGDSTEVQKASLYYMSDWDLAAALLYPAAPVDRPWTESEDTNINSNTTTDDLNGLQATLQADEVFKYGMYLSENPTDESPQTLHFGKKDLSNLLDSYGTDIVDIMLPAFNMNNCNTKEMDISGFIDGIENSEADGKLKDQNKGYLFGESNQFEFEPLSKGQFIVKIKQTGEDITEKVAIQYDGTSYYMLIRGKDNCTKIQMNSALNHYWTALVNTIYIQDGKSSDLEDVVRVFIDKSGNLKAENCTVLYVDEDGIQLQIGNETKYQKLDKRVLEKVKTSFEKGCHLPGSLFSVTDAIKLVPNCTITEKLFNVLVKNSAETGNVGIRKIFKEPNKNWIITTTNGNEYEVINENLLNELLPIEQPLKNIDFVNNVISKGRFDATQSVQLIDQLKKALNTSNDPITTTNDFLQENAHKFNALYRVDVNGGISEQKSTEITAKIWAANTFKCGYNDIEIEPKGNNIYDVTDGTNMKTIEITGNNVREVTVDTSNDIKKAQFRQGWTNTLNDPNSDERTKSLANAVLLVCDFWEGKEIDQNEFLDAMNLFSQLGETDLYAEIVNIFNNLC